MTAINEKEVEMVRSVIIALLLTVLLPLSGCVGIKGTAVTFDYYSLEYEAPDAEGASTSNALPVILRLQRFGASPEYGTDRIVYRDSSNKRSVYFYHKWRAMPADLVTFFLKRDLSASGRFAGVLPPEHGSGHTHILDGVVEEFLEWDTPSSCEAVITVNIVLLNPNETDATKRVLLQKRFTAREECEKRQPSSVAMAMSRAMARLSSDIGESLQATLQNAL